MHDQIYSVLITGFFMILASGLTGLITLRALNHQKKLDSYKFQLKQAYRDIAAFHRLEELYVTSLSSEQKSANAWKREKRKQLRDEGFLSPSEEATSTIAEQRLKKFGSN